MLIGSDYAFCHFKSEYLYLYFEVKPEKSWKSDFLTQKAQYTFWRNNTEWSAPFENSYDEHRKTYRDRFTDVRK